MTRAQYLASCGDFGTTRQNLNRCRAVELEFEGEDVQQPPGRSTGVAALMFQVLDLFDGDTKPVGKLSLGHTGMLAQGKNTACSPIHRSL